MNPFGAEACVQLAAAYPDAPALLSHGLCNHPLLSLEAIGELAARLPGASVEYNRGSLPLGVRPEDTPTNGLTLAETIRTIAGNDSWAVLKNVEQDPAYAALLDDSLAGIEQPVMRATGPMLHREGFIFISSPGSVTPFHIDPEHNILLQIAGTKAMTVFPPRDAETVPARQSEAFALGGHRNLVWDERFRTRGRRFELGPGEAVLVPVKAPHFVENGSAVSISFSITWRSARSVAEGELHALNARLRRRRLPLVNIGTRPERQWAARGLYRLANRLNV